MARVGRIVWLVIGLAALAAASLGVVLPLVPTTPFVLLAAFAFMKSSRRLHDWLLEHRVFGTLIADWRRYGAISRKAKAVSVLSLVAVFALSVVLQAPTTVLVAQVIVLTACAAFIVSRPSPPRQSAR